MAPSNLLYRTTLVMSVVAAALVHIAVVESHQALFPGLLQLAMVLAIAAALHAHSRNSPATNSLGRGATLTIVLLATMPFLAEPISRSAASHGNPLEVQLALSLRNVMLGLAAVRSNLRAQRLACLTSLFIVLFSFMWTKSGPAIALLVLYTVLAMWWLLGAYWDGLGGRFAKSSARHLPKAPAMALTLLGLVVVCLLPLANSSSVTTAIAGFFPSSGGTGAYDPFARSGVGDGDQLVAAQEDAMSFGPIESELFLESEMPSLYDVIDELYDEPAKFKRRGRVRAIPLAPSTTKESHQRTATTKQAGREFSLIRQPPQRPKELSDRPTHALFSVAGRVPLHLKLATFNEWDGRTLSYVPPATARGPLATEVDSSDRKWASLETDYPRDLFPTIERHVLRVLNLKTKRVPSPPQLTRLHVDQMRDASLFDRTADQGVAFAGDLIPQLTVLYVDSRPVKQHWLADANLYQETTDDEPHKLVVSKSVANLARRWTNGLPRGWEQVNAICTRLRSEYRVDAATVVPTDCQDAAQHFLANSRSGPDYLFAASAALLLRSLGYETQVASGFYAKAEQFDPAAGQTPVFKSDVHFWTEVLLDGGVWLTIEPTPGYELLYSRLSWSELLVVAARYCVTWLENHKWNVLPISVLLPILYILRRRVLRNCAKLAWRWRLRTANDRGAVLWTLWLIETHARLSRAARPANIPPGAWWASRLALPDSRTQSAAALFLPAMQWALYGDAAACPLASATVRNTCHEVIAATADTRRISTPST